MAGRKNPLPPPKKGKKPKRITTPGKPGDSGPGGAHPGMNRPKPPPPVDRSQPKQNRKK